MKFFKVPFGSDDQLSNAGEGNRLQQYIQSQSMKDMAQLAAEISPDVKQMIGTNVQALLGYLPSGEFTTTIMSSKDSLQNLLASAMLTGYFLHAMEQRMVLEDVFEERPREKKSEKKPQTLELSPPEVLFKKIRDKVMKVREEERDHPEKLVEEIDEALAMLEVHRAAENPAPTGQFLSADDLQKSQDKLNDEFSIQLEINTQMSQLDLSSLLRELRALQDAFKDEKKDSAE